MFYIISYQIDFSYDCYAASSFRPCQSADSMITGQVYDAIRAHKKQGQKYTVFI